MTGKPTTVSRAPGGDDLLLGFGGDDTIQGKGGADSIDGGDGNDLLYADYFDGNPGATSTVDTVVGGAGDDTLVGDVDKDILSGGADNDLLRGLGGRDAMNGGAGNDTLEGGAGADLLIGGQGQDTFLYQQSRLEGGDKIKDFTPADDQFLVSAAAFGAGFVGNAGLFAGMDLAATGQFVANLTGKATTAGLAQFIYDTDDGKLYFDVDGKGGVYKAELLATLTGAPTLTAADITVIA